MFKKGENVVYPTHGVGTIEKIEEKTVLGKKQLYYFITINHANMTMMVPVDQCKKIRLRKISTSGQLMTKIFSRLTEPCDNIHFNWKVRYSNNHEKLKEGSVLSLTEVVRDLFHRNQIKELSQGEKRLFDSAFQLLCDELSYTEKTDSETVKTSILDHLKSQKKATAVAAT